LNIKLKKLALKLPFLKRVHGNIEQLRSHLKAYEAETQWLRAQVSAREEEAALLRAEVDVRETEEAQLYSMIYSHEAEAVQLRAQNEQLRVKLDSQGGIKYRSCAIIEDFYLYFNRGDGDGGIKMKFCCEVIENHPRIDISETAGESVLRFLKERAEIISESIRFGLLGEHSTDEKRKYTSVCAQCVHYQMGNWGMGGDGLIHIVNLAMYPAPCQSKCLYCEVHGTELSVLSTQGHKLSYQRMFDIVEWAQENGWIAGDAAWQIVCGEITIHPFKDRFYKLVEGQATTFFTNCFVFDENIAANLAANPRSSIYLSIDSGTRETWRTVKGSDNFPEVLENLRKYYRSRTQPGQIGLKYLILPGINDIMADYLGLIEIMDELNVSQLTIACDNRKKYLENGDNETAERVIKAGGYLTAVLIRNGKTAYISLNEFKPDQRDRILAFADGMITAGEV